MNLSQVYEMLLNGDISEQEANAQIESLRQQATTSISNQYAREIAYADMVESRKSDNPEAQAQQVALLKRQAESRRQNSLQNLEQQINAASSKYLRDRASREQSQRTRGREMSEREFNEKLRTSGIAPSMDQVGQMQRYRQWLALNPKATQIEINAWLNENIYDPAMAQKNEQTRQTNLQDVWINQARGARQNRLVDDPAKYYGEYQQWIKTNPQATPQQAEQWINQKFSTSGRQQPRMPPAWS